MCYAEQLALEDVVWQAKRLWGSKSLDADKSSNAQDRAPIN
jgi:hypothetical protein